MRIIALEKSVPGKSRKNAQQYLQEEATRLWEMVQDGTIKEVHFRQDRDELVLFIECLSEDEAKKILDKLPLVEKGYIAFELIALRPYPGYSRGSNLGF
jgi:uncharacterized protein (UPF0216 family)